MGHEFGGIIEEVGDDVTHVYPGQRAVVRPTIYDGTCSACQLGYNHCCENIGFIGLSGKPGIPTQPPYRIEQPSHMHTRRVRWRDVAKDCRPSRPLLPNPR